MAVEAFRGLFVFPDPAGSWQLLELDRLDCGGRDCWSYWVCTPAPANDFFLCLFRISQFTAGVESAVSDWHDHGGAPAVPAARGVAGLSRASATAVPARGSGYRNDCGGICDSDLGTQSGLEGRFHDGAGERCSEPEQLQNASTAGGGAFSIATGLFQYRAGARRIK